MKTLEDHTENSPQNHLDYSLDLHARSAESEISCEQKNKRCLLESPQGKSFWWPHHTTNLADLAVGHFLVVFLNGILLRSHWFWRLSPVIFHKWLIRQNFSQYNIIFFSKSELWRVTKSKHTPGWNLRERSLSHRITGINWWFAWAFFFEHTNTRYLSNSLCK